MAVDTRAILKEMKIAIGKDSEFTKQDWLDVRLLLEAAVMTMFPLEYGGRHAADHLKGIQQGYGCWLDWVETGLEAALDKVPDPMGIHNAFYGAVLGLHASLWLIYERRKAQEEAEQLLSRVLAS